MPDRAYLGRGLAQGSRRDELGTKGIAAEGDVRWPGVDNTIQTKHRTGGRGRTRRSDAASYW
jgi:hypothetical protein